MSKQIPGDLPDDLGDLARRYVDLWQDQMTALATDPEFAESLRKVMDSLGPATGGLQAVWASWPAAMTSLMAAAQPRSDMEGQKTDGAPDGRLGKDSSGAATP